MFFGAFAGVDGLTGQRAGLRYSLWREALLATGASRAPHRAVVAGAQNRCCLSAASCAGKGMRSALLHECKLDGDPRRYSGCRASGSFSPESGSRLSFPGFDGMEDHATNRARPKLPSGLSTGSLPTPSADLVPPPALEAQALARRSEHFPYARKVI